MILDHAELFVNLDPSEKLLKSRYVMMIHDKRSLGHYQAVLKLWQRYASCHSLSVLQITL